MISGHQTLGYLDQGLGSVRKDVNRIDSELNHVSEALHDNRRQQATAMKELAKIRLDEITQGSFLGELEAADQRALALLEDRNRAYKKLETEINKTTKALTKREKDRETALKTVNKRAQAIIDCEHKIQEELETDKAYQQQLQTARKVDDIAEQAEQKAKLAETDRQEKGLPYENNALFMYMWKRKYGTPDYQANTLTRFLDSWVEDLCNYDQFRVNYWTLLEIPKRLRTHSEAARNDSNQALEKLEKIETKKTEQAGLPELQAQHTDAIKIVDGIDDDIEHQEDELNKLLQQRTQYIEAKDSFMEESLKTLSTALSNKSVYELNYAANLTINVQDNLIVRELAELDEQHRDLEEQLSDQRRMHQAKLQRLQELEDVRRQFKNRRFDDIRSGFGNEGLISSMLGQFLNGLVGSGELWRVLQRLQRHRDVGAWPDFGSGGLGRPNRRRSPWHFPTSRGNSGGGFRLPRSGGFSSRGGGGGFRTGGGF
ncbi:MAG: hypothetical protein AB8D52_11330 [Gammaproteobacteria bacterium]